MINKGFFNLKTDTGRNDFIMPRTPYEMFVKVGEHNLLEQKRNEESKKSTRKRQRDVFEKTDEYSQQYVGAVTASFVFEYGD